MLVTLCTRHAGVRVLKPLTTSAYSISPKLNA
jgi:hypothetical protein